MASEEEALDDLIHDVRSKCANLGEGAERLRTVTPEVRRKLLSLMLPQARHVVELLAAYEEHLKPQ